MSTENTVVEFKNELPVMVPKYLKEIEALKEKYGTLTLTDLNDKKQLALIATGRKEFKAARVGVEKFMKSVRDGANAFSKSVIAKEKEIVALIEPEEARLQAEEDKYNAEVERLAEIKRQEEEQVFNHRVSGLVGVGFVLTANGYTLHECTLTLNEIRLMGKSDWDNLTYGEIKKAHEKQLAIEAEAKRLEEERIAEENRLREENDRLKREEALRLEVQRQEQEAKEAEQRKRQEELERKEAEMRQREEKIQAEEQERQRKIDEEKARIEAEKQKVVEEERRKKEIEDAEKAAAERERQRIAKEAELAEAKRVEAAQIAAAKAARMPDKKKLLNAAHLIKKSDLLPALELKTSGAQQVYKEFTEKIEEAIQYLITEAEKL